MSGTKRILYEKNQKYLDDIDVCIRLLENLKVDYTLPGYLVRLNASKINRTRITINELLKNQYMGAW